MTAAWYVEIRRVAIAQAYELISGRTVRDVEVSPDGAVTTWLVPKNLDLRFEFPWLDR